MAKQIIVLGVSSQVGGEYSINAVFWYPVEAGKELPAPSITSAYKLASAAEITALQSGSVLEESRNYIVPSSYTIALVETFLLTMYNAKVAYMASKPETGNFYGFNYDGTVWNNVHG